MFMARSIGTGSNRATSTSKRTKIIARRKNRREKGVRADPLGSNPHSKGVRRSWDLVMRQAMVQASRVRKVGRQMVVRRQGKSFRPVSASNWGVIAKMRNRAVMRRCGGPHIPGLSQEHYSANLRISFNVCGYLAQAVLRCLWCFGSVYKRFVNMFAFYYFSDSCEILFFWDDF